MTVCVVGSINLDVVSEVEHLPAPGETVPARAVRQNVGGKGANQAVAAARAGAEVVLVAKIGADDAGRMLRAGVGRYGVGAAEVRPVDAARSGTAFITVDTAGENIIVVDPGANDLWPSGLGSGPLTEVVRSSVLVLQHEIPREVVREAALAGAGRVVLNAAPARPLLRDVLAVCDPLVVNEAELAVVAGESSIEAGLAALLGRGVPSIVVTLGSAGARWVSGDLGADGAGAGLAAAPVTEVVDTTGAGDCFAGVLAARLAGGSTLAEAVPWAVAAASLSVRRRGTHEAYPSLAEIRAVMTGA